MSVGIKRDFEYAVAERVKALSEKLASGGAADYAEYCRGAGEIRGLKRALDIFGEVYERYIQTDEEGENDGD